MKILQLSNRIPYPPKDGGAIGILIFTKEFFAAGHEVSMLAMNTPKHYFDPAQLPEHLRNSITIHAVDVNTQLSAVGAFIALLKKQSYHLRRFISKQYESKLIELLQNNRYDVIQLEGLYLSPYVETIRKYSNALIAMRAHNVEYKIWERNAENAIGLKKVYLNILTAQLKKYEIERINQYDVLMPVTQQDADIFLSHHCKIPIHVCPAPFSSEIYSYPVNRYKYSSLFFIGSLDWLPNINGLLWFIKEVWKPLQQKFPELEFHVAGRNMPEEIKKLKENNLIIHGEVEDAYQYMSEYSVMIVPLFAGSGIRVKIVEAMALGKAIISTAIGAEGISYTDGKNMMIANTVSEFCEKIAVCIANREVCMKLGAEARKFAEENFSAAETAKKRLEFFEQQILVNS
jgi:glycosyltransferase involved in cell wall biosynthesis